MRNLLLAASILWAATAAAHQNGITGVSGKAGGFCNQCHSGGATPTVALSGPATLTAGQTATYTLTITGGAAVAGGLDAALDDGALAAGAALATVSPSTQRASGEITHTQPVAFAGGALAFQFAVTAPAAARTMTLYAAGNSTNHDGTPAGDRAAATTMTITVAAPPPPGADLAVAPGADLATNPTPAASDLATPSPSGRDLATPAGDFGSAGPPAGPSPSSSGCSIGGRAAPPSVPWLVFVVAAVAVALVSRRARRAPAPPAPPAPSASWRARARR